MSTKIHTHTDRNKNSKLKVQKNQGVDETGYLYKITLVALVTRGNETMYFAFDFVLFIILNLEMLTEIFLDGSGAV